MEGPQSNSLLLSDAAVEQTTVANAYTNDYCPYPEPQGLPWWIWAIPGVALLLLFSRVFKWYKKQRFSYWLKENGMLKSVPMLLDSQKPLMKLPILGSRIRDWFFSYIQNKVPNPPQHLMSSAPSNSPGVLTVLKEKSELVKQCKHKHEDGETGMLTSDDFAVLPAQPRIFRTVDGFGNCPFSPHIGQAAQPYSFVALSPQPGPSSNGQVFDKRLPPVEDIFNKLLKRKEGSFEANEAGLNCLILDFATLLTHDLFNSHNGYNENSSYADLSPLYGHDSDKARRVRLFKRGLLDLKKVPYSRAATIPKMTKPKPGTDVGQQEMDDEDRKGLDKHAEEWNWDWAFVGWRALVELFGREHNYVAGKLLEWYPKKFTHEFPDKQAPLCNKYDDDGLPQHHPKLKGLWINDEALYQTARYITTRIYANIIVTDYASNFLGLKQLNDFIPGRNKKKVGNCCSYEFGLLYHWHCLLPDDSPNAKQTRAVPCLQTDKAVEKRGPVDGDYYDQLDGVEPEPHKRTLDKLRKEFLPLGQPDTVIQLDDLILSRYETRIGRFGAFHTPAYLEAAEIRTMDKARKLGVGTYNDFRSHLGLMPCTTYEEINPNKEVAAALRELYELDTGGKGNKNVDNVELYPGIFAERSGFNGIKFGNILSLGLLEDALNLIRNDRLLVDFDPNTATAKGYEHAVSSHFADVIERNTGLKLVKQPAGSAPVLAGFRDQFPTSDWRSWRLASCSLLTVPDEIGTAKTLVFDDKNGPQPAILAKWPQSAQETPAKVHRPPRLDHLFAKTNGMAGPGVSPNTVTQAGEALGETPRG